jgi:hypothetical protein
LLGLQLNWGSRDSQAVKIASRRLERPEGQAHDHASGKRSQGCIGTVVCDQPHRYWADEACDQASDFQYAKTPVHPQAGGHRQV